MIRLNTRGANLCEIRIRADPIVDCERERHRAVALRREVAREPAHVHHASRLRKNAPRSRRARDALDRSTRAANGQRIEHELAVRSVPIVLQDRHEIARRDAIVLREAAAVIQRRRRGIDTDRTQPSALDIERGIARTREMHEKRLAHEVVARNPKARQHGRERCAIVMPKWIHDVDTRALASHLTIDASDAIHGDPGGFKRCDHALREKRRRIRNRNVRFALSRAGGERSDEQAASACRRLRIERVGRTARCRRREIHEERTRRRTRADVRCDDRKNG